MAELLTTRELITGLLKIGGTPNIEELFELIVSEAPKLVGAKECSIFWKNGAWREQYRRESEEVPDGFYRRATYEKKKHLIGINFYRPGEGLTGWVVKHGKSLRIDDITNEGELKTTADDLWWSDKGRGYRDSEDKRKQRAFLAVPVIIDEEVLGVIRIAKTVEPFGKFSEEAEELLKTFAEHIGAIIKRVEEAKQKDLWEKLYLSGIDFEKKRFYEYLRRVADAIPNYLRARACSIFLTEYIGGNLVLKLCATTTGGPLEDKVGVATYGIGEGLTGWVAEHKETLLVRDVDDTDELKSIAKEKGIAKNPKHVGKHEEYVKEHSSFLGAPIYMGEEKPCLGVIRVAQDSREKFFSPSDQRLIEYFCKNLAVLVENVHLFEKVEFDRNRAMMRLGETKRQLEELRGPLIRSVTEIRNNLRDLVPGGTKVYCFKLGSECVKTIRRDRSRVFIGIPFSPDYKNVYNYGIKPAIEELDLGAWVAFEQRSAKDIMCKICEGIQSCYVGIVDISEWNPNVLFELGLLYGQGHPVILLKKEDAKVPVDLAGLEYIQYTEFEKLAMDLEEYLKAYLEI